MKHHTLRIERRVFAGAEQAYTLCGIPVSRPTGRSAERVWRSRLTGASAVSLSDPPTCGRCGNIRPSYLRELRQAMTGV